MSGLRGVQHLEHLGLVCLHIVDIVLDRLGGNPFERILVIGPVRIEGAKLVVEGGGMTVNGQQEQGRAADQGSHGGRGYGVRYTP